MPAVLVEVSELLLPPGASVNAAAVAAAIASEASSSRARLPVAPLGAADAAATGCGASGSPGLENRTVYPSIGCSPTHESASLERASSMVAYEPSGLRFMATMRPLHLGRTSCSMSPSVAFGGSPERMTWLGAASDAGATGATAAAAVAADLFRVVIAQAGAAGRAMPRGAPSVAAFVSHREM